MIYGKDLKKPDVINQLNLDEADLLNEYLEIIIEFGYMTLFAESAPFAPIFILLFYSIELRSDLFKLSTVTKRPHNVRKRSIGIWFNIMSFISILSVFTNLLFTMTYNEGKSYVHLDKENIGFGQMLNFFILEHSVLIIFLILRLVFSSRAPWVQLFYARREYNFKNKSVSKSVFKTLLSKRLSGQ
jgi:hypothetical protein